MTSLLIDIIIKICCYYYHIITIKFKKEKQKDIKLEQKKI